MTIQPNTPPWPLPEHRSPEQLARDREAVAAQVRMLAPDNERARTAATAVTRILRRQTRTAEGKSYVSSTMPNANGPVLVAEDEIVIRAADSQLAALEDTLLAGYTAQRRPGRETQVLRCPGKSPEALRSDIARLRAQNIAANVNQVLPLGYVVKADAYPALTAGLGDFAAAEIDETVRVAIIDTGRSAEDRDDAWFTGVVPTGTDPLNVVAPLDRNDWFAGHGTFTAGVVRQIAPTCEILVYRFTGPDGLGTDDAAADAFIRAADDADRDGRRLIINASFGAPAVDGVPPLALQEAVEYISTRYPEVLIVASAGNDGIDEQIYPAAFRNFGVKAVGALNFDLTGAAFSNRGDWVDCSTVGVGIVSTFVEGKLPPEPNIGTDVTFPVDSWAVWSGTSFTAPQISAAVAQLCTENAALNPRSAFDQAVTGRPTLNGFGTVVHLLRGTPTA
jgi:thermitase